MRCNLCLSFCNYHRPSDFRQTRHLPIRTAGDREKAGREARLFVSAFLGRDAATATATALPPQPDRAAQERVSRQTVSQPHSAWRRPHLSAAQHLRHRPAGLREATHAACPPLNCPPRPKNLPRLPPAALPPARCLPAPRGAAPRAAASLPPARRRPARRRGGEEAARAASGAVTSGRRLRPGERVAPSWRPGSVFKGLALREPAAEGVARCCLRTRSTCPCRRPA